MKTRIARLPLTNVVCAALLIALTAVLVGVFASPSHAQSESSPKAYVGIFKDNTVAVIDTSSNQVLTTIPVPTGPHGLAITDDGKKVYVSSDGDTKVSVIDTSTDTISDTIEVGKAPNGLTLTPDNKQLLVAVFGTGQVVFIDTNTDKVVNQVNVPSPHNIAISPDGKTAYVSANYAADANTPTTLAILDVATHAQTGSVDLKAKETARTLNFSPDGKKLYFTQTGVDSVNVLDTTTNMVVAQIATGASPHLVLLTPDGEYGLVVSQKANELSVIDPETDTISTTISVGQKPHWIAVIGDDAYITNETDNTISVVDLKTSKVTSTISVGNAPRKIVIQPSVESMMEATQEATAAAKPR